MFIVPKTPEDVKVRLENHFFPDWKQKMPFLKFFRTFFSFGEKSHSSDSGYSISENAFSKSKTVMKVK